MSSHVKKNHPEPALVLKLLEFQVRTATFLEFFQKMLGLLTPSQHMVIAMRFGLEGFEESSYEKIAATLDLTRERIRIIETKALRLLRQKGLPQLLGVLVVGLAESIEKEQQAKELRDEEEPWIQARVPARELLVRKRKETAP